MRAALLALACLLCTACTGKQTTTRSPQSDTGSAELEVLERQIAACRETAEVAAAYQRFDVWLEST